MAKKKVEDDIKYTSDKTLPQIVQEINKRAKTTKITFLSKSRSHQMKRFFSGSISVDAITGGGYAFKRIHVLFGTRSAGKNALLYQMIAYNQRICRFCHGIIPEYTMSNDRHGIFLYYILRIPTCKCGGIGRIFIIYDFEKSIEITEPHMITVNEYYNKENGHALLEEDYLEAQELFKTLELKKELTDVEKKSISDLEMYFENVEVKSNEMLQQSTLDYLQNCGIFTDKLLLADPSDTEEGIESARELISSKEVDGIIWDSIQAAVPRWVKGRDAADDTMGKEAKQNALLMRHICSSFAAKDLLDETEAYKPAVFLTSQMRSSMSQWEKDDYSGGHGVKHHNSLALELKREQFLTEDGIKAPFENQFYGQTIRARAEKNKLAPPGDMFEFDYYFRSGLKFQAGQIDHVKEIVNLGVFYNIIEKSGGWYKVMGESIQGMDKFAEVCRERPDFVGDVYDQIKEKFQK
jgi:RecA/RadA recombinase